MKTKLLGLAAVAALAIGFASSGAQAQSSKFAAAYDKDGVVLAYAWECEPAAGLCDQGNSGLGFAAHMADIKAPQGKELLIGLSAVPILLTYTEAKGKNGEGFTTSVALAGVGMAVRYAHHDDLPAEFSAGDVCDEGTTAEPGIVPLSIRLQALAVKTDLQLVDGEGEPVPDRDIEGDVTVALALLTAASHHYNFLAPNLERSGNHAVAACFVGGTLADVLDGKDGKSFAIAALGKRILTVQEVRAIKDAVFDVNE